jgi:hypothetical protein
MGFRLARIRRVFVAAVEEIAQESLLASIAKIENSRVC